MFTGFPKILDICGVLCNDGCALPRWSYAGRGKLGFHTFLNISRLYLHRRCALCSLLAGRGGAPRCTACVQVHSLLHAHWVMVPGRLPFPAALKPAHTPHTLPPGEPRPSISPALFCPAGKTPFGFCPAPHSAPSERPPSQSNPPPPLPPLLPPQPLPAGPAAQGHRRRVRAEAAGATAGGAEQVSGDSLGIFWVSFRHQGNSPSIRTSLVPRLLSMLEGSPLD